MTKMVSFVFCSSLASALFAGFDSLPLVFEPNAGQVSGQTRFLSRGQGFTVGLSPDLAQFRAGGHPVEMRLMGANANAAGHGEAAHGGTANYFRGRDRAQWLTGIPLYERVRFAAVYPGIDLVYYGNARDLEYDFVVAPGADPRQIALAFRDLRPRLEGGELVLETPGGTVRQRRPVLYQERNGKRIEVSGGYQILDGNQIGFTVGDYDRALPLTIDPILQFSTLLGGRFRDLPTAIALDNAGNVIVAGTTTSNDFPQPVGSFPNQPRNPQRFDFDLYVAKLNPSGTQLLYSAIIGGSDEESGGSLAVDSSGNAYVAGTTRSINFPTTVGVWRETGIGLPGDTDGFVAKLNPSGTALVYSTRVGGRNPDTVLGVAVDTGSNAYLTGETFSFDFPVTQEAYQVDRKGPSDAFVVKFNPSGSGIVYSTLLGGEGNDQITTAAPLDQGRHIVVDRGGAAYVAGLTTLRDFPVTGGAAQNGHGGLGDVFVTKVNADGKTIGFSTLLGGRGNDVVNALHLDSNNTFLYVGGATTSENYPVTTGALQNYITFSSNPSAGEGFVTKLNANGQITYSTYLGASGDDAVNGIASDVKVDATGQGNAYVIGTTSSTDLLNILRTSNPIQAGLNGGSTGEPFDAFLVYLNPGGTQATWATFLGGSRNETGQGIARDSAGNLYVTGQTNSTDFRLTPGALQRPGAFGTSTSFVSRIGEATPAPARLVVIEGDNQSGDPGTVLRQHVVVEVRDEFNSPVANATVTFTAVNATLSNNAFVTASNGRATAQVTLGVRPGRATVTARLDNLAPAVFTLTANLIGPPLPLITRVMSAGRSTPPVVEVAPLGLGIVQGESLAPSTVNREAGPEDYVSGKLPNNLAGTCVTVDGVAARILSVNTTEIRFQVPERDELGRAQVVVITNCGRIGELRSDPFPVEIRQFAPEFFYWTQNPDGGNPVLAVNTATGVPVGPDNLPGAGARPNDVVAAVATGLGPTSPVVGSGDIPEGRSNTAQMPVLVLDNKEVPAGNILYAGLEPGQPGVYRVEFRVPDQTRNGNLPIQLRSGLFSSPAGGYLRVTGGLNLTPRLTSSPTRLDFGEAVVGSTSTISLTLANSGNANITVNAFSTGLPVFTIAPNFGFLLGPGESRVLTVRFSPTAISTVTTALSIATDDLENAIISIPMTGSGIAQPPPPNPLPVLLSLNPSRLLAGGAPMNLFANGRDFTRASVVEVNGQTRPTFFNHSGQLIASLSALDIIDPRELQVTVFTPPPAGGRSQALTLSVDPSEPLNQRFSIINQLDTRFCPAVTSFVSVFDSNGLPVRNLGNGSITCSEGDRQVACTIGPAAAETPLSLTLVYGINGVNNDETLALLKSSVRSLITTLQPLDEISIVHLEDVGRLQLPFTTDKERAFPVLETLRPIATGNALYDTIIQVSEAAKRRTNVRKMVLFITALDNQSGVIQDLNQALGTARSSGVTYYTVAIGPGTTNQTLQSILRQLSRDTYGQFFSEPNSLQFSQLFGRLAITLQSQYSVAHYSPLFNGLPRELRFDFRTAEGLTTARRVYAPCLP